MSNSTDHESNSDKTGATIEDRSKEFLKQVKSEPVPSGIRPDLAPPGPDGAGSDGGGIDSSI